MLFYVWTWTFISMWARLTIATEIASESTFILTMKKNLIVCRYSIVASKIVAQKTFFRSWALPIAEMVCHFLFAWNMLHQAVRCHTFFQLCRYAKEKTWCSYRAKHSNYNSGYSKIQIIFSIYFSRCVYCVVVVKNLCLSLCLSPLTSAFLCISIVFFILIY